MSKARDLANAGTALTSVSATELGYLDGVTSAVQTQIDSKIGQSTAINPTIVDAKGDIIAATAADTVARLAVGTNNQVLTADSSTATGLKWATADALPSQTSKTSKFLSTDGTTASWQSIDGSVSDWSGYAAPNTTANNPASPQSIRKVNGYWFITTGNGFIFYSSDAKSWTRWSNPNENVTQINGVVFGNNTYVFYGDSGTVSSGTTIGGTLTSRTSQFSADSIMDAVWMGGSVNLFILVGSNGKVSTSPDGTTWTARTANQSTGSITSIAVNDTGTLAILTSSISLANNASYSSDGTTWTAFSPDDGTTTGRNGVIFYDAANTKWIYCGSVTQWWESTSPTSGTWTTTVRQLINYSQSNDKALDKPSQQGTPFISKDVTNNKWIIISPFGNGWYGIYTIDPTVSYTVHNGKTYQIKNIRTVYISSGLGLNTYQSSPAISIGYADGVFVASGNTQLIYTNA